MRILFDDRDLKIVADWLKTDDLHDDVKPEDFATYMRTLNSDVDGASIQGEYEWWVKEGCPKHSEDLTPGLDIAQVVYDEEYDEHALKAHIDIDLNFGVCREEPRKAIAALLKQIGDAITTDNDYLHKGEKMDLFVEYRDETHPVGSLVFHSWE